MQTGPGTYKATFDARGQGSYVVALNYRGRKRQRVRCWAARW